KTQGLLDRSAAADVRDGSETPRAGAVRASEERAGVVPVQQGAVLALDPVLLEERLSAIPVPVERRLHAAAVLGVDRAVPRLDRARELALGIAQDAVDVAEPGDLAALADALLDEVARHHRRAAEPLLRLPERLLGAGLLREVSDEHRRQTLAVAGQ